MPVVSPRPAVRLANRALDMMWRHDITPPPVLDADVLIADARRSAKFHEFNEPALLDHLARLAEALNSEAGLTPLGRTMSYGGLKRALVHRLRCEAMLAADPEIEKRPLAPPIVIVGPMRSGTTRLQRLLTADRRVVSTRLFEALNPAPDRSDNRRILATRAMQWSFDRLNPAIRQIHPGDPRDSDEELGVLELALSGAQIEAQRPIPSWARWMERTPQTHAYRWLKRWMQLTGHRRGDDPAKPWVLKTPQYMQDLPALLDVFPDARLIFIHRDPRAVVASAASLAWNYVQLQSDRAGADWCGEEWLHKTAWRIDAARAFRSDRPHVPMIDVRFQDMNRDWEHEIGRIYDWLNASPPRHPGGGRDPSRESEPRNGRSEMDSGLRRNDGRGWNLTAETLAAMRTYTGRAQRAHLATPHRYTLADFGLTPAQVDERLGAYAADFDLA